MRSPKTPVSNQGRNTAVAPADPEELASLQERIELFLAEHPRLLLSEPGREVIDLGESSYSLSTEYNKLICHVWNDRTNLVRQVTGIARQKPGRMELRCQRFGKGTEGTLILADTRAATDQLERRGRRLEYSGQLRRWLLQLFPDSRMEEMSTEASLKDSLSGCYARGLMHEAGRYWAVLGAGADESPAVIIGILTYGIIWLDLLRRRFPNRVITGLRVFVPQGHVETTQQRMAWLDPKIAHWELYETGEVVRQADIRDSGNLRSLLSSGRSSGEVSPDTAAMMRTIERLSPRVTCRQSGDGLYRWSVNGLVFARQREGRPSTVVYGLGRAETELSELSLSRLERLVRQILEQRTPRSGVEQEEANGPGGAAHPLYRLNPEAWLESVVLESPERVVPDLRPQSVRSQVLTLAGNEGGFADLLGVTRSGRMILLELKTSEDIHLPLQALDYWIAAHWHQQRGQFTGIDISGESPRLLLVSPGLQFHPTCETILRYLAPEIEVEMVGVNEGWRTQLQIVFRR